MPTTPEEHLKKLHSRLAWPVQNIQQRTEGGFHIVSNPEEKVHRIFRPAPDPDKPPRPEEYAHELCHAWLGETVHFQFATHIFTRGTPQEKCNKLAYYFRAANDWFVDYELFRFWPEAVLSQIPEHVKMIEYQTENGLLEDMKEFWPGMAMVLAQDKFYLGNNGQIPKKMKSMHDVLLDTDPSDVSEGRLRGLVNKLLQADNKPFRLSQVDGYWKINRR